MSQFKKATRKITAVAASAAMVSSMVFGASLSNYSQMFVEDDKFNGKVVVGTGMGADDMAAAQAVIEDLRSEFTGGGEKIRITYREDTTDGESVAVESSNDDLNFGELLNETEDEFDDSAFPSLLAEGIVEDTDFEDEEYDYEQRILTGDAFVDFGRAYDMDDETDVPEIFLNLGAGSNLYTLEVEFKDTLVVASDADDEAGLSNSESIEMFGKTFTFDPTNDVTGDAVLFASSNVVTINQGDNAVSVESEGETYEVEVVGANSDSGNAILSVNGVTKSVDEGTNTAIAGLDVYVDDVFISNVGGDRAAVKLFLGSDEISIPISAFDGFEPIEVDGDGLAGYEVQVNGGASGNWTAVNMIEFRFNPADLDEEVEYLRVGDSVADPLFGTLNVEFAGASEDLEAGNMFSVERSSDDAVLTFTNRDGEEYSFEVFTGTGSAVNVHGDFFDDANYTAVGEDDVFILQEDTSASDFVTKVYQVVRVFTEDGDDVVEIEDLTDGSRTTYDVGDEIDDTEAYVQNINTTSDTFDIFDAATGGTVVDRVNELYTENDVRITIDTVASTFNATENMDENIDEDTEVFAGSLLLNISSDADEDINMNVVAKSNFEDANDEDNDFEYGLSMMGSYYVLEVENDGEEFVMYTPIEELDYIVNFVAGEVADTVTVTVDADDEERLEEIRENYTVLDEETISSSEIEFDVEGVTLDTEADIENSIVVGGPAVNALARELLGIEEYTDVSQAGVEEGSGLIQYFEDTNSVLVYGYTKDDTIAAVNELNAGGLTGEIRRI